MDENRLTQAAQICNLTSLTPCAVQVRAAGKITLQVPSAGPVRVAYDGRVLHASVEEIPIEESLLHRCWGELLYRILLHPNAPPLQSA